MHTQGGAHTSRCIHKAVHTQGGAHKRRYVATTGVLLFKGPQARWCIHKAVEIQGSAYTRRCTQKAVCSHRGRQVILRGCGGVPRIEQSEPKLREVHIQGGAQAGGGGGWR